MSGLGDRIKGYEKISHTTALNRMPVFIRVDGRAFHTFTKNLDSPFDGGFMRAMVRSAEKVAKDIHGFKAAYIQSDEATFCLTDYDTLNTQGWFDYDIQKMASISASLMTAYFNKYFTSEKTPVFDGRAFNVPEDDVVNSFLWRAQDWERNSLQMYCRSFFSHKEMHGKKRADMHEMLFNIGKNWATDLSDSEKNGTFLILEEGRVERKENIPPNHEGIKKSIGFPFEKQLENMRAGGL